MNEISCKELKEKIERNDQFKLVNCLSKEKFEMMHIPGSINFPLTPEIFGDIVRLKNELSHFFDIGDEIVVYCTDNACQASIVIYNQLNELGYEKLKRFSGGLKEWQEDGYSLEGSLTDN